MSLWYLAAIASSVRIDIQYAPHVRQAIKSKNPVNGPQACS